MSEKDAYRQKWEAQIAEQMAKLDLLKAKAKKAVAEGKIAAYREIDEVEQKLEVARGKLKELSAAGEGAWQELRAGFEEAWKSMSAAWQRASEKFK